MANFPINAHERDLLAALTDAAAEYQFHGTRPMVETLRQIRPEDFPALRAMADRLETFEVPNTPITKLNW